MANLCALYACLCLHCTAWLYTLHTWFTLVTCPCKVILQPSTTSMALSMYALAEKNTPCCGFTSKVTGKHVTAQLVDAPCLLSPQVGCREGGTTLSGLKTSEKRDKLRKERQVLHCFVELPLATGTIQARTYSVTAAGGCIVTPAVCRLDCTGQQQQPSMPQRRGAAAGTAGPSPPMLP